MADSILTDAQILTGAALATLISDLRPWVHRRVEQVEVIDDVAVTRRASIDLTVPELIDGILAEDALQLEGQPFVPLTFLKKEPLRGFDLRDAAGQPVPLLSKRVNGALATNLLVSQAEAILGKALPAPMREPLHRVAESSEWDARDARDSWERLADDARDPHQAEWAALVARDGFKDLGDALVADFIVCAAADPKPGERQIFKLAYEQPFGHEGRRLLAWRWKVVTFDAPQAALADSYHFELAAPTDMELDAGWLRITGGNAPSPGGFDFPEGQRVHLYVSQVAQDANADVRIWLRARRHGNLRAAFLTSLLCTVLLWILHRYRAEVTTQTHNQITAGLLLLGPTLLTAALVRPGEHRLLTTIFFWIRALTVISMLACLAVVALLAGVAPNDRDTIWLIAAITSSVSTFGLLLALIGPLRE